MAVHAQVGQGNDKPDGEGTGRGLSRRTSQEGSVRKVDLPGICLCPADGDSEESRPM